MTFYSCKICNYYTELKSNYNRHIKTKIHNKKIQENSKKEIFICKYCNRNFTHHQSMYRHIKYYCNNNKDEGLKELVRLMNLKMQQKDKEIEYQKKQNEKQQKQIDKLMDKLQVTHITNNTTNHIQNNIQLLSYKETDISHLTENDYVQSIKKVSYCVKEIIERIHFNPKKPENMNIYISNLKDKYIMIFEEGNWNIKHKNNEIDTLYDKKEMLLEDWIERFGNKDLKEKFEKYMNNKEHNLNISEIKEEIKLMMYNKKNV